jgi:periplasmic divalent cation tolerance protein
VEDNEVAMLAKTKTSLVDEVTARVKELHSYEVHCIISFPIAKGHLDYLKWIEESTK